MSLKQSVAVPVVVATRFKIKPEKRALFLELANAALEPTLAEEGVISYAFYEDAAKPNFFIYFEEWKSRQALSAHLKQPYVTPLLEQFPEILDGQADVRVYDIENITHELE